jgi:hypothetical protein
MHNKTVKRRVNKKKGGSPTGNTETKRKRMPSSPYPHQAPHEALSIQQLERYAKKFKKEEKKIDELLPLIEQKILNPQKSSIVGSTNNVPKPPPQKILNPQKSSIVGSTNNLPEPPQKRFNPQKSSLPPIPPKNKSNDSESQAESNDSESQAESNDSGEGPASQSEDIHKENVDDTKANDSYVSVYSDKSDKQRSGIPLFVISDSKKRKNMDVGVASKDDSSVDNKPGKDDIDLHHTRVRRTTVDPSVIVPVVMERSKDDNDLLYTSVSRTTSKKRKDKKRKKQKCHLPDRRVPDPSVRIITAKRRKQGSLQNISKKAQIFVNPKNVPKSPPPPKKLPKRIVALRLYNYYRDKSIPNNKKDSNHYLDYICHIRCKDGFNYTIDNDIERTIISNGPVEFDFSYRCQHVPFSIKRKNALKICSCDFEVNADYFKNLNNMTHRPKDKKTEYLEYVNSLTKEEDIYEIFLTTGNVIEFLTDEESCDTTNVTYLDEEIDKQATVDKSFYQIIDEDHANIYANNFKKKNVFNSDSFNMKFEYRS